MEEKLNDQELSRRKKMEDLRAMGIDPFGQAFERTANSKTLNDEFGSSTKEEIAANTKTVKIAGRIMSKRRMGKIGFIHLLDKYGQIQAVVNKNIIGEENYEIFKQSDLGDIIGIEGEVFRTDAGELSINVTSYTHLSKALHPLPEKFHGLQNVEERYRRRYLDLITNEESRRVAFARPRIIRAIQSYLEKEWDLVEVETTILQPILGGASARPFITHHNTLDRDFYLRIATELPLKRLIVGGMEGVYEIGRIFRNEGMDPRHNPEFTTVEAYVAYSDLEGMMRLAEGVFKAAAYACNGNYDVVAGGHKMSLEGPFKKLNMVDAVSEKTGSDFRNLSLEEAETVAKKFNVELEPHEHSLGHIIDKLFEELCEGDLIEPTFVYGHPIEISPLAKKDPKDPRFTLRFELYVNGIEYANAFTELNDPIDQKERFLKQVELKNQGDEEASEVDEDYIEALEYGMPPAGGIGIGIDRLVMLLTGKESIQEVILFPTMKPSDKKPAKRIETPTIKQDIDFSNVKIEPIFTDMVDFETFAKSDFRAVKILDCKAVEKSKKLLKFTLDDGERKDRTILSGIHEYYEPEELIGKTAIAIVNLPPRKMMGIDSEGMLISAVHEEDGHEGLNLLMVDDHIPAGAKLY